MGRLAVINGVTFAPEQAKVSIYDRGFLYGDSVFETIRTYGGVLFELSEHLRRLERSAASMGIVLPAPAVQLGDEAECAVRQAQNPESYVRLMLTRGSGPVGLDPKLCSEPPLRVIMVEPLVPPPPALYRDGITAVCVQTVRASDAAQSAKIGNYLASALALQHARQCGADEALVVNREGIIVEGTTANAFFVQGSKLITPPLEIGILAGITRKIVLDLARRLEIPVELRALTPEQAHIVEEVFFTSSIRELVPIVSIDGHRIGTGRPGPVTRRLHLALRELAGIADHPPPWTEP